MHEKKSTKLVQISGVFLTQIKYNAIGYFLLSINDNKHLSLFSVYVDERYPLLAKGDRSTTH
jgi:hypothetical protein